MLCESLCVCVCARAPPFVSVYASECSCVRCFACLCVFADGFVVFSRCRFVEFFFLS